MAPRPGVSHPQSPGIFREKAIERSKSAIDFPFLNGNIPCYQVVLSKSNYSYSIHYVKWRFPLHCPREKTIITTFTKEVSPECSPQRSRTAHAHRCDCRFPPHAYLRLWTLALSLIPQYREMKHESTFPRGFILKVTRSLPPNWLRRGHSHSCGR